MKEQATSRVPRCASCGGRLRDRDLTALCRLAGAGLAMLAAVLLTVPALQTPWDTHYAGAAGAAVLALLLMRARVWWVCVECGARFAVRPPPRGGVPEAQNSGEPGSGSGREEGS